MNDPARGFDLNLLRVLLALDSTRHVTRAADSLGMSQSGFSSALARLREHTSDQLFVRSAGVMTPTPRAQLMIKAARDALRTVSEGVLAPPGFDPLTTRTEFRLAMPDLAELVFLPRLMERLQTIAPLATVRSEVIAEDQLHEALAAREVDLAIGYFPDLSTQVHVSQRLYRHTFACLVRRGHPLEDGKLTLRCYATLGHVVITNPSRSSKLFEAQLQKLRIARRVALRIPHHLSVPSIVERTGLIATVPLAVGRAFAAVNAVQLLPLPFRPEFFDVKQHWHRRYQHDARHRWLRQQISVLFNDASDDWLRLETSLYGACLRSRAPAKR